MLTFSGTVKDKKTIVGVPGLSVFVQIMAADTIVKTLNATTDGTGAFMTTDSSLPAATYTAQAGVAASEHYNLALSPEVPFTVTSPLQDLLITLSVKQG